MSSVADQRFTSSPLKPQLVTDDPVAKVMAAMRAHRRRLRPHGSAPNKWHGQCPCASSHRHGDRRDSLAITWDATTARLLVKCHCGCPTASVVDALGLRLSDLFLSRQLRPNVDRRVVGEPVYYDYTQDENGAPIHVQKVRMDYSDGTKALHWRHECHGEWRPGLNGVRVGLFNIEAVHGADGDRLRR